MRHSLDSLTQYTDIVIVIQSIRSFDVNSFFAFRILVKTVREDFVLASNRYMCWWEWYASCGHPWMMEVLTRSA